MLEYLFGPKIIAAFDIWSIEHVLSGLSVGHIVKKNNRKHVRNISLVKIFESHSSVIRFDIIGVLFVAYLWETIEHYLETGLAGPRVIFWFQGVEAWSNRIVADPLLMILGYYIALNYPKLVVPARVMSVIWLVTHIFVFPHSMYLQELIFR